MLEFCLHLSKSGKRMVYTPFACMDKGEWQDAGQDSPQEYKEKRHFQQLLKTYGRLFDPFYNPSLLEDHGIDEDRYRRWLWGEEK